MIESISYPFGEDPDDRGGVSPMWFKENAEKWKVKSVKIMLMPRSKDWTSHRYHVFMMKDE